MPTPELRVLWIRIGIGDVWDSEIQGQPHNLAWCHPAILDPRLRPYSEFVMMHYYRGYASKTPKRSKGVTS